MIVKLAYRAPAGQIKSSGEVFGHPSQWFHASSSSALSATSSLHPLAEYAAPMALDFGWFRFPQIFRASGA